MFENLLFTILFQPDKLNYKIYYVFFLNSLFSIGV